MPRRRGVLGGLVVIALGVPFILQPLGVPNAASYLFISMGLAFLISYVRGRQYVYLIPMVTLAHWRRVAPADVDRDGPEVRGACG